MHECIDGWLDGFTYLGMHARLPVCLLHMYVTVCMCLYIYIYAKCMIASMYMRVYTSTYVACMHVIVYVAVYKISIYRYLRYVYATRETIAPEAGWPGYRRIHLRLLLRHSEEPVGSLASALECPSACHRCVTGADPAVGDDMTHERM